MRLIREYMWLSLISCVCLGGGLLPVQSALAYESILIAKEDSLPELPMQRVSAVRESSTTLGGNSTTDYILGPGDNLSIKIIGYPEFDDTHSILPDGTISFPLIGTVQAGGKTLGSLAQVIKEELGSAYLVNPVVDLSLLSLRPVSVTISGEVNRPGPIQFDGFQNNNNNNNFQNNTIGPTLVSALIEAGGVTHFADIREVTVRRPQVNGYTETITLNFWDSLVSESTAINMVLRDGDSVIVPRLSPGESLDRSLIARSTVAPGTVRVKVVGEVMRPGEVAISPASSLSSAIATAGGPTEDAKLKEVAFIRVDENNTVTSETFDLRTLTDSIQVQDGDVIVVPKKGVSTGLDFLARLANPLRLFTDIFRLFE